MGAQELSSPCRSLLGCTAILSSLPLSLCPSVPPSLHHSLPLPFLWYVFWCTDVRCSCLSLSTIPWGFCLPSNPGILKTQVFSLSLFPIVLGLQVYMLSISVPCSGVTGIHVIIIPCNAWVTGIHVTTLYSL